MLLDPIVTDLCVCLFGVGPVRIWGEGRVEKRKWSGW